MRWMNAHYVTCSLIFMVLLSGCGGGGGGGGTAEVDVGDVTVVVNSGKNQYISTGSRVLLDASDSQGFDGQKLISINYIWQLVGKPNDSQVDLADGNIVTPFFISDVNGEYEFELTVSKEGVSETSLVKVVASSGNSRPMVEAGKDMQSIPGQAITLDGLQSSDANGDDLSYDWTLIDKPNASQTDLSDSTIPNPQLTPDVAGTYKVQLVVNDGQINSEEDTITIEVKEGNVKPLALAGNDIHKKIRQEVQLNGNESRDVNGDVLQYRWIFSSIPAASQVSWDDASSATPSFTPDQVGSYLLTLQTIDVLGEADFDSVVVFVAADNVLPVAHAGFNQTVNTDVEVTLNGAGSYDVNQDTITYRWRLITPEGEDSQAEIQPLDQVKTSFIPDVAGDYIAELVVKDAVGESQPVRITITVVQPNRAPVANPGADVTVLQNIEVTLNGNQSTDEDNDELSHKWSLTSPEGSSAVLVVDADTALARFTPDQVGSYVIQLIVNDGTVDSQPVSVTVTVEKQPEGNQLPVAMISSETMTTRVGDTVSLNGSTSSDADGGYQWTVVKPDGSHVELDMTTPATPSFVADQVGEYQVQLIVNDGTDESQPVNITITVVSVDVIIPTANAGNDQTVTVGSLVTLDGSQSTSNDESEPSYAWAMAKPEESQAQLSDDGSATQTFVADVAGNYEITLEVTNGSGETHSVVITVTVNTPPTINTFSVTPEISDTNNPVTFNWDLSDLDGDVLTCQLDVDIDGDSIDDYVINDCLNVTSQTHIFSTAGSYTARLTVSDGIDTSVKDSALVTINPVVPLVLDVSASDPVMAGGRLLYTITVSNVSANLINDVSVMYVVPAGIQFHATIDAEPNTNCGSVCIEGEEALWSLGTLVSGVSRTIELNASILPEVLSDSLISAPIRVMSPDISDMVSLLKTTRVYNKPISQLSLSSSKDGLMPGEAFDLILDVGNIDSANLTDLQLRTQLPVGMRVNSISDGGVPDETTGEIIWDMTSLAVGSTFRRYVNVTVPDAAMAGQILLTRAELRHADGLEVDVSAEHVVSVVEDVLPLMIEVSTALDSVAANGRSLYMVTVSNVSAIPVNTVNVQYRVPSGLQFHATIDAEPDTNCGSACIEGEEALWSLGTLASGESRTIELNASILPEALSGSLISALIRVTSPDISDTVSLLKTTRVYNKPISQLSLSSSKDGLMPGEAFDLILDVGNIDSANLTDLKLRIELPVGMRVNRISDGGVSDEITGEIIWEMTNLAVSSAFRRHVNVTVPDAAMAGKILLARAELRHADGLEVDVSAEHVVSVVEDVLPLMVEVSTALDPVAASGRSLYMVTVSNVSAIPVNTVNVQYRVPTGLQFHATIDAAPDTNCGSACIEGEEALWSLGTLASGESRTIELNASILPEALSGSLISALIRVTSPDISDTVSLLKTTRVYNKPISQLSLSSSKDGLMPGEAFDLILDVGNIDSANLTDLQLRIQLPVGMRVNRISDGGVLDETTSEIIWDMANLAVGSTFRQHVNVTVPDAAMAGQILARAELRHADGLEVDVSAEHVVTVVEDALPLMIAVNVTPGPIAANGIIAYTFTVNNVSAIPVNNIHVQYRIPVGIEFHATIADPDTNCGSACIEGEEALWNLGTLASGEKQAITLDASVLPDVLRGTLISAPIRVTSPDMSDTINLLNTVAVSN